MRIHFVFIGEGTSDEGIIPHLENLCIDLGVDEVTGTAVDFSRFKPRVGRTVEAKLRAVRELEPEANLVFVHRDADGLDPAPRHAEIQEAAAACNLAARYVAVVPVQETEAWLLLDETAIRFVAGRPKGRQPLKLPRPAELEQLTRPKERLMQALVTAAELTGRRLDNFQRNFPSQRRLLLDRLPLGGDLAEVSAWRRLRDDVQSVIAMLRADEPEVQE